MLKWLVVMLEIGIYGSILETKFINCHISGLGEKFCNGPGTEFVCSLYHLFFVLVSYLIYVYHFVYLSCIIFTIITFTYGGKFSQFKKTYIYIYRKVRTPIGLF